MLFGKRLFPIKCCDVALGLEGDIIFYKIVKCFYTWPQQNPGFRAFETKTFKRPAKTSRQIGIIAK
jgi:hypothetical protein